MTLDVKGPMLGRPDLFVRLPIPENTSPVPKSRQLDQEKLFVFEPEGEKHALLVRQMTCHHLAQGVLATVPFLTTFWVVCDRGAVLAHVVNGALLHSGPWDYLSDWFYSSTMRRDPIGTILEASRLIVP